jgi:hypothetical protein
MDQPYQPKYKQVITLVFIFHNNHMLYAMSREEFVLPLSLMASFGEVYTRTFPFSSRLHVGIVPAVIYFSIVIWFEHLV